MGRNYFASMASLASLINVIMPITANLDPNCTYYQFVGLGELYYIYSPGYPYIYPSGSNCRWIAQGAPRTRIVLSCETVEIPLNQGCLTDRFAVSLSGDGNFSDARNYCGGGTLSAVSDQNRLAVGLFTNPRSQSGRFVCTITAIENGSPPTTQESPQTCDCGWRHERRITGGVETGINEYPAMAAMINLEQRDLYCGATIIAEKYVITAAHCCNVSRISTTGVLVGDHNIRTGQDTPYAVVMRIEKFIINRGYNTRNNENDIALVKTQNVIQFSSNVGPICLPFRSSRRTFEHEVVTALGWGTTSFTGPKSDTLQEINLTVLSNRDCQASLPQNRIFASQICTFAPDKDACQSDSGGPVLWLDPTIRRLELVGIIDFGISCGGITPGVNTRVTSFLAWIVSKTVDTDYCIK